METSDYGTASGRVRLRVTKPLTENVRTRVSRDIVSVSYRCVLCLFFFFFNDPAPPEISPLPLPDALPISPAADRATTRAATPSPESPSVVIAAALRRASTGSALISSRSSSDQAVSSPQRRSSRSEEHTSELQSPCNLVCRLLLEKKKNQLV